MSLVCLVCVCVYVCSNFYNSEFSGMSCSCCKIFYWFCLLCDLLIYTMHGRTVYVYLSRILRLDAFIHSLLMLCVLRCVVHFFGFDFENDFCRAICFLPLKGDANGKSALISVPTESGKRGILCKNRVCIVVDVIDTRSNGRPGMQNHY